MPNLERHLIKCDLCPNACGVDRTAGERGRCRSGAGLTVSAAHLHFGEEPMLVGGRGSGTIFLAACNLSCVYCQNYDTSQLDRGRPVSEDEFIRLAFVLQEAGAANLNLVSPTHQASQIFSALIKARRSGLHLPVVYNCGGYENPGFLKELDGLVDIYMPDVKYATDEAGEKYSGVKGYAAWCRKALKEMHRQTGDLVMDAGGLARRGLLVRHLVLPHDIAGSRSVIDFIADEISPDTVVNIMDQYRPCWRAAEFRELSRSAFRSEVDSVIAYARERGLRRILS